jgi:prolyl oligopeptidase
MKRLALITVVLAAAAAQAQWSYPATRTVAVSDTYFGRTYADPYRWLEQVGVPETDDWYRAQATLTDSLLGRIARRDSLAAEWLALDRIQPARYSSITVQAGRVFYKKRIGGENLGKVYYRDGWDGTERLLFDPTTYRTGTATSVESMVPSWDGRLVALGLSANGAEYAEIRVLDVAKGQLLAESMYPSFGPTDWTPDSQAFFYDAGSTDDIRSPEIELNRKTRLHRVGDDFANDRDFFSNVACPGLAIGAEEFPTAMVNQTSPEWLFGYVSTVQNEMRVYCAPTADLARNDIAWQPLCQPSDHLVRSLVVLGQQAYAVTYDGAPRYRVVRTRVDSPQWQRAETVIAEAGDAIQYLAQTRDYLFVVYSNGVVGRLVQYDPRTGTAHEVALPLPGMVDITCPDVHSNRVIVTITSWTQPTRRFDLDPDSGRTTPSIFDAQGEYPGFDQLISEEVEVPGHDGALVPLSIVRRRDLPLDGSSSCVLEGYGAYGLSVEPYFSVMHSLALRGVVLAFAHVRGGSEKGEAWYKAGFKTTKPNTWRDFLSCAQYLIDKGYTRPEHLAGTGTSAGGILISRAVTERPDLFAAAVCNVGCANAMRMEFSPNGPVNTPEFGTVKDSVECQALGEMDGVQHVQSGERYPAVLGVAGWNDPRVAVWEPGKFVAALQQANASSRPCLLKVNYDNGHFTEDRAVTFRNFAGQYAFMLWQTGHPAFQPTP